MITSPLFSKGNQCKKVYFSVCSNGPSMLHYRTLFLRPLFSHNLHECAQICESLVLYFLQNAEALYFLPCF